MLKSSIKEYSMQLTRRLLRAVVTALFILGTPLVATAQPLPAGLTHVTELGGITEYRLDNGLRVLLLADPSSPKTTVNITYLVGSRHEGYGETGMAHLLEHLMFKGSTQHPSIPQELTEHGASANGTTWFDRTNYYETFPSSPENLDWALSLESDRMTNSFIAQKDLDSEMTVVRNEFERGENSPEDILQERIFSTAYLWHNYGKSTIGARSDIEAVPIDRLKAFYRTYYQPDNAILIVAGRFDPEATLEQIATKFGSIAKPTRKLQSTYTQEPTQDGERAVLLRRSGDTKVFAAAYHVPAGTAPDFAAVDVLGQILADTPSGRLYKALVVPKLATSVGGGAYQLHDPGLLYVVASTRKDGNLAKVAQVMLDTLHGFTKHPPTAEEVERAKKILQKSADATMRDSRRLALQLSEWASLGDWRTFFLYRDRLAAVTPQTVAQAAKSYLKTSNQTVGRFIPDGHPDRATIEPVSLSTLTETLNQLKVGAEVTAGEEFDPTPDNIKARTRYSKISPQVDLAMLAKKNRGQTVIFSIEFQFNNLKSSMNQGMLAGFTGSMLMHGTNKMTREEIKDTLIRLEAQGSIDGDINTASASFSTTREHLPELLKVVAHILKEPSFPQQELDTMREGYLASLEEAQGEPESRAALLLGQELDAYPVGDPRHQTTPKEDAAAAKTVTIEGMKAFHRSYYGADRGQIAIVGDFDPKEIEAELHQLFGNWKAQGKIPYQRLVSKIKSDVKPSDHQITVPDKANAIYLASKPLAMTDDDPDYAALRLGNYMLGGGFLNSRLATRIRQKEGLSYSIRSSFSADTLDPVATFSVQAIAAPENISKVAIAVKEEIARAIADGFSPAEVEAAKRGYLESLKVGRSQDGTLAAILSSYLYVHRDVDWLNQWEAKIQALTPDQIQTALTKHFNPEDLVVVTAGSFSAP